nr:unknown unsecreted protein [Papilio xuthus]
MKIPKQTYKVKDLYKEEESRVFGAEDVFETRINPTGVRFYKFTKCVSHGRRIRANKNHCVV